MHAEVNRDVSPQGLTRREAEARLRQYGPNAVREVKPRLFLAIAKKFWAPVPWMLEATVILELILGKRPEAIIIGFLLVFNAGLGFVQEKKARDALALLRKRLPVNARALRDGRWETIPAEDLVPGDFVHVRLGDIMPADVRLAEGHIQLDQSTLTGESLPLEAGSGQAAFAGSVVIRGEASGEVTATGARTYFGKTAELVRTATTVSHLQAIIFTIVKYLVMLDGALVLILLLYSRLVHLPVMEMLPFALMLLVASVPVALPATFTVATALGSIELAGNGVLVTRLSAIEEAAAMEVLCSDKTGTITQNRLAVTGVQPYAPYAERDLLRFAMLVSDAASQDPIDLAILAAGNSHQVDAGGWKRLELIPFEPATKLSEAVISLEGERWRAIKGAPDAVAHRVKIAPDYSSDEDRFAAQGYRVLAVAAGSENDLRFVGLVALEDPPRSDSKELIQNLHDLGVRVVMITGDALPTARAVASRVGIGNRAVQPKDLEEQSAGEVLKNDVFAGVFPEDKFHIVQALQGAGVVTGMTGDGVNDAPALKQAEVGIAVANATDVAKAAASLVLTNPGLSDILAAVKTSRRIYQRMLTYTLNKIIKTIEIAFLLSVGLMLTRSFIITPLLIVLLLFTNDFVTMSIATDNVSYSQQPDRWHIRGLVLVGLALGSLILVFSFGIFFVGRYWLQLPLPQLQTLVFITLVFTGQGTVYLVRERRHFWNSRPGKWLVLSSAVDILVVSFLAWRGILMEATSLQIVFGGLIACGCYLAAVDFLKTGLLGKLPQGL
ncbi:MAG TPA: plasma-membrane proton-efflux P-type ATPase [Candidatus Sulfotelmatobacter sp.]|nr:plasma-membrane proton-efflux P-type ATPase [Candidatus Sulfotelmatobacter sp.]